MNPWPDKAPLLQNPPPPAYRIRTFVPMPWQMRLIIFGAIMVPIIILSILRGRPGDFLIIACNSIVVFGIPLLLAWIGYLRSPYYPRPSDRPIEGGLCTTCGYDLRATPLRCPECGTITEFKQWLDKHPLERTIYEGRLKPHLPRK